jgi:hypothetical protein
MATVAKSSTPSLMTLTPPPSHQLTRPAFTDMAAGDMVYLKADGTFALTDGTANDAKAQWWGMINRPCKAGQPVTAYNGCEFAYGAGLTVGARYYVSATPGALSDVATTGGDVPSAFATSATSIFVMYPRK